MRNNSKKNQKTKQRQVEEFPRKGGGETGSCHFLTPTFPLLIYSRGLEVRERVERLLIRPGEIGERDRLRLASGFVGDS